MMTEYLLMGAFLVLVGLYVWEKYQGVRREERLQGVISDMNDRLMARDFDQYAVHAGTKKPPKSANYMEKQVRRNDPVFRMQMEQEERS